MFGNLSLINSFIINKKIKDSFKDCAKLKVVNMTNAAFKLHYNKLSHIYSIYWCFNAVMLVKMVLEMRSSTDLPTPHTTD